MKKMRIGKTCIVLMVLILIIASMGTTVAAGKPSGGSTTYTLAVNKIVDNVDLDATEFTVKLTLKSKIKGTGTVSEIKPLTFSGLVAGTYTITEAATTGYSCTSTNPVVISIGSSNPNPIVSFTNYKIEAPPTTLHYVALGDSIATGTTLRTTTNSYVKGYYSFLILQNPAKTVSYVNLASNGDTSTDLLSKLNISSAVQTEIAKADVITISIGGNNIMDAANNLFTNIDTTSAENGTKAFENEYASIISKIRQLNGTRNARILTATLYNPYNTKVTDWRYPNDPSLQIQAETFISRINAKIRGISDSNYRFIEVHDKFLNDYAKLGNMRDITYFYETDLASYVYRDPHPNQTGQNLILSLHSVA